MEDILTQLQLKITKEAKNGEIRIYQGYLLDTRIEIEYLDENNNLITRDNYSIVDIWDEADDFAWDENLADPEGNITIAQQIEFSKQLINHITNFIQAAPKYLEELALIRIDIGDKMSDGSWDDFHIQFSSN